MTKHIDVVRAGALVGILVALVLMVGTLTVASAQEVVTEETTVTYCTEADALNYEEVGECRYEQEDTPFCADETASNYGTEAVCEYPSEPVTTCDDVSATNFGAEATCVYDTPAEEEVVHEETTPVYDGACEIEGHKYDETGTPLMDWVIGLMKVVTYEGGETEYRKLVDDMTDGDGYYCLEWDGYTGTEDLSGSDETYSFIYRVYELIKDGWENVSVEIGPDHESLVVARDLDVNGVCAEGEEGDAPCINPEDVDFANDGDAGVQTIVSIDVSDANGIIYADAALHVDFYNTETDGGDGETEDDTYKIFGFVWHDKNENDLWEKEGENTEDDLAGWTVKAVNGEDVRTTTTDENGRYEFNVPAGTWTITEVTQNEWIQTLPNEGGYVVTVPPVVEVTLIDAVRSFILPTAYAATVSEHGPYDFGLVFKGCVTDCGSSSGGGSSSGSRKHGSKSSSSSVNDDPVPQVLGEATSVLPEGAPNTGFGGTGDTTPVSLALLLAMIMSMGALRAVRHEEN